MFLALLTLLSWSSMASNVFLKTQFHCGSTSRPLAATSIVENIARGEGGTGAGRRVGGLWPPRPGAPPYMAVSRG